MSKYLPLHCLFYVTMTIYFRFHINAAHDVVMDLLTCVNIYDFTNIFSHAHTEAHTLRHTCIISTQEEWRQPGTGAWLGGAEERLFVRDEGLEHSNNIVSKTDITNQEKIRAHRASSNATRLFLAKE